MKNIITICFLALTGAIGAMPLDSIGRKVIDGKVYIMHKVSKGEGVYGIGKKYGVPASEIFAANEGSEKSIQIGQILLIPRGNAGSNSTGTGSSAPSRTEKVYHTVSKGQTLSTIARLHQTSVDRIKELNHLKSDNIQLGQKLIVAEKSVAVSSPKPAAPQTSPQTPAEPAPVAAKPAETAPQTNRNVVVSTSPVAAPPAESGSSMVNNTYNTDDGDEVSENGTAVVSTEGELSQERSFILHPTAKVGTIVMITNPENNNTVFARVVGNCKNENGVLLKMSKTVAGKLGASGNTEVKVSYAK